MLITVSGSERTGSTVLRQFLCSGGALDADEMFHGTLNHKHRFYSYVLERVRENSDLIFPIFHGGLFYDFISVLEAQSDNGVVVADIKYKGLRILNSSYSLGKADPFIKDYLGDTNSPLIHVRRRNKLRVVCSTLISQATGVWSLPREALRTFSPTCHIEPTTIHSLLNALEAEELLAESFFSDLKNRYEIYYDELFNEDGSQFSEKALAVATKLIPGSLFDITPRHQRINGRPLCSIVDNYSQVLEVLEGTRFEWMARDVSLSA